DPPAAGLLVWNGIQRHNHLVVTGDLDGDEVTIAEMRMPDQLVRVQVHFSSPPKSGMVSGTGAIGWPASPFCSHCSQAARLPSTAGKSHHNSVQITPIASSRSMSLRIR